MARGKGEHHEAGRWVIEGDLSSSFDTVDHKKLMRCVRGRIRDQRFTALLWKFLKAGHIDKGLFRAAEEGVPRGGVLSPLLPNIVLSEFDQWMDRHYVGKKARQDRRYWNRTITDQRPIAFREGRTWVPAVVFCRYADDCVLIVTGLPGTTPPIAIQDSGTSRRNSGVTRMTSLFTNTGIVPNIGRLARYGPWFVDDLV